MKNDKPYTDIKTFCAEQPVTVYIPPVLPRTGLSPTSHNVTIKKGQAVNTWIEVIDVSEIAEKKATEICKLGFQNSNTN